ncbi:MAG: hypothetical protein M3Q37_00715 [Gemmatimonadota bacterium]|nr:hypothetical protein [Gemmatimonadota bacterium]
MPPRIIFNGQEYPSPEAMPADVRKAFQDSLAQLANGDTSVAEVLERLTGNNVIGIKESSISINGLPFKSLADLPTSVRWLFDYAQRQRAADLGESVEPSGTKSEGRERWLRALDSTQYTLGTFLQVIAAFLAGVVIVGGVWLIVHMDEGSKGQGGAFYVMLVILVALGWLAGIFMNIWWRRRR